MNTSIEPSSAAATLHEIPIEDLVESGTNPRTRFDQASLNEMAESIAVRGILNPLLVRARDGGGYEIVDGARRFRVAQMIGLERLPCLVRAMSDVEVREAQLITGLQRTDLHPLDEAEGYRQLMAIDPDTYSAEIIAHRIGKSKKYVYDRLKLGSLAPAVKEAFAAETITAGHAILLARLTPDDQARALEACHRDDYNASYDDEGEWPKVLRTVRDLDRWIASNCRLNLEDETTRDGLAPMVREKLDAGGDGPLEISTTFRGVRDVPVGVLHPSHYREIDKNAKRCEHAREALIVHGEDRRGDVVTVCADKACATHFPPESKKKAARSARDDYKKQQQTWEQERKEREQRTQVLKALRPKLWALVVEKTKAIKTTSEYLEGLVSSECSREQMKAIRDAVGPITPVNFARAARLADAIGGLDNPYHVDRIAKEFGIDLKKLEAEAAKPAKPAVEKKAAPAKTAKPKATKKAVKKR